MALGPRLDLRQTQSLVMTPQLQQAIRLLAASNLEIETFITEALESNPLLDAESFGRDEAAEAVADAAPREELAADRLIAEGRGEGEQPLDLDPAALDRDFDTGDADWRQGDQGDWGQGDWGAAQSGSGMHGDMPGIEAHGGGDTSLAQHLHQQIGVAAPDPASEFLARHLIGLLDEAGYLAFDLAAIAGDLGVTIAEVEQALVLVQSLDPSGVGARGLAECLAIQAREADRYDPCMARLIDNLDLLARGEFARLKRMCGVDDEDFAGMLAELRGYDPKPGLAFGGSAAQAVVPDILVSRGSDGSWQIALNEASLPSLVVNRSYLAQVRGGRLDRETQSWLREKLADANWLIRALDQRARTILRTASEIVRRQDGFFRRGVSELRPLTLREVAEAIDMHESTVSRVTSNKYLACERGTFELKYFFTSGVGKIGGSGDGEGASSQAVKARIRALTDAEDPKAILSDDTLVEILRTEGFDLARRTVAKYREAMGIGSSVQRRRAKKLREAAG
ncbi:MAG: RNA polymerase sigma-54 factor [Sphingomonadales bacterium BRH_c42]|nr:MAG: RNA polymerase sigma-54 factor [Sphingomonadales bacterium BRH_c42]